MADHTNPRGFSHAFPLYEPRANKKQVKPKSRIRAKAQARIKNKVLAVSDAIGCRMRPAKNFLGLLNRRTKRLGIRTEENLVNRSLGSSIQPLCLDIQ